MVDFGFLTFLHEADYWERSERGDLPVGLTLLMAANALRYVLYHARISVAVHVLPPSFPPILASTCQGVQLLWLVEAETSGDFAPISSVPPP
jgi:hypothetical protein